MKIAFVHDWEPDIEQEFTWQDGLAAAVRELIRRGHSVDVSTVGKYAMLLDHPYFPINFCTDIPTHVKEFRPDVILIWADGTRPNIRPLSELGKPMALCFSGGDTNTDKIPLFEHIFVESAVYQERMEHDGLSVSRAFGTNTDLFAPISQPKIYDTILPATFAAWKRHNIYAAAVQGLRSLAVGYMYTNHEVECWLECVKRGVMIMPHVSAQALHCLYAASKVCVITSSSAGGSQRTVLEAMAMNIPLIVTDSDKFDFARGHGIFEADPTPESIRGHIDAILDGDRDTNTRQYVVDNWSHINYANELERGLQEICQKG